MTDNFLSMTSVLREKKHEGQILYFKNHCDDSQKNLPPLEIDEDRKIATYQKLVKENQASQSFPKIILFYVSGGSLSLRAWPLYNYVSLARGILKNSNYFIVLTGEQEAYRINEDFLIALGDSPPCQLNLGLTLIG